MFVISTQYYASIQYSSNMKLLIIVYMVQQEAPNLTYSVLIQQNCDRHLTL